MTNRIENDHAAWPWPVKVAFAVFVTIAAYFLVAEHRAHVVAFLPWLLLAACPLMHLFMHHGHRGHGGHRESGHDVATDAGAGASSRSGASADWARRDASDARSNGPHGGHP